MSTKIRSRTLIAIHLPGTEIQHQRKKKRFRELRPDGQHLPSTATFSRVTLKHARRDKSTTHAFFQQKTWRGNLGTHHPCKEQASSRTNKDGKEYVKHHIPGQRKTWSQTLFNKSEDGSGPGQGKSAAYEITDGHPTKGKDLEEGRRETMERRTRRILEAGVPSGRG